MTAESTHADRNVHAVPRHRQAGDAARLRARARGDPRRARQPVSAGCSRASPARAALRPLLGLPVLAAVLVL